nr:hypothetical protein [Achromobacter xylosoxidans]
MNQDKVVTTLENADAVCISPPQRELACDERGQREKYRDAQYRLHVWASKAAQYQLALDQEFPVRNDLGIQAVENASFCSFPLLQGDGFR